MKKTIRPFSAGRKLAILALLLPAALLQIAAAPRPAKPERTVSFAAGGDHGRRSETTASLRRLAASGTRFYLALGDLSYGGPESEEEWCGHVREILGDRYPFQLVSGNHEDDEKMNGWIGDFVRHCPDRIGVTGSGLGRGNGYGAEYYFDYPASNPLVRVFMISPNLAIEGTRYAYPRGGPHYEWLARSIDQARENGISWIVVGMHRVCLSAASKPCQIGTDLMNLLIDKRVDLVLQGHDHDYQRSKQLACARKNVYVASCVADDGSDGRYAKGAGTVFVIAGTFGEELDRVKEDDSEAPYFAAMMGGNTPGKGHGFVTFTVSADRIDARTDFSGAFQDRFSIVVEHERASTRR